MSQECAVKSRCPAQLGGRAGEHTPSSRRLQHSGCGAHVRLPLSVPHPDGRTHTGLIFLGDEAGGEQLPASWSLAQLLGCSGLTLAEEAGRNAGGRMGDDRKGVLPSSGCQVCPILLSASCQEHLSHSGEGLGGPQLIHEVIVTQDGKIPE